MFEKQDKNSYRQSLKATSIFGSVQLYTIIIQIVKSKFVAILLGPEGMGILGLFTSTTGLITALTNMGLSTTAVRDIVQANSNEDPKRISLVIKVFRRLVWLTGLIGFAVCLFFAPLLSNITFGNTDYTFAFIILSCTLLFTQLTAGQTALLQGMRKYNYMALSTLWGSTIGLLISIPLYYFFGFNGIVPVIVVSSIISLLLSTYYSRKIKIQDIPISFSVVKNEGKGMLKMGFFLALQGLLPVATGYLIRIYIAHFGNLSDIGFFNAGFMIIDTYVGLVFTAMAADYYPRLSTIASKFKEFNNLINQQIEIGLLLLSPLIIAFIVFIRFIITILYSSEFILIEGMVYWAIFATFFKALSWSIAFSFLAKAKTKLFFFNELIASCYGFVLSIVAYNYWGLTGLGISYFVKFVLYFIQVWIVCGKIFKVKLYRPIFKILIFQFIVASISIGLILFFPSNFLVRYIVGVLLLSISCLYSYVELDKRIGIKEIIKNKIRK